MDELFKYYEIELATLGAHNQDFAERYPMIAGRLGISDNGPHDPHVERLIQAYAMFNARTAKRLDDSRRELTEALLEVNYPHYLRPFPSCSIIQFDNSSGRTGACIARGTQLHATEHEGVVCKFNTAYDVQIAPVRLADVRFSNLINVPATMRVPSGATAMISIAIESTTAAINLKQLELEVLRAFIDAQQSLGVNLRDALFIHAQAAYLQTGDDRWQALDRVPIRAVGFDQQEALIPFPASSHPAHRLLTEYFAFPEKFNFIDIELSSWRPKLQDGCRRCVIHLALSGVPGDSHLPTVLRSLSTRHLQLNCTPIVNLFKQPARPIRLNHTSADYPLVAESRPAHAYDIYSVDSVQIVRQDGTAIRFHPYYSMRHGEAGGRQGRYFLTRRDKTMARTHPGYDSKIAFVDSAFDPMVSASETVSVDLTCSNREFPVRLKYGAAAGDLKLAGGADALPARMLRRPSPPYRFDTSAGAQWRLISHLSLNHQSLVSDGLSTLKEMLELYNLPGSAATRRQIDGIVGLHHRSASIWLNGRDTNGLVYGIDVLLTVDETAFAGGGLHVFAQVLERVLGMYVHLNSYTRLIVLSAHSGKELIRCPPISGSQTLA